MKIFSKYSIFAPIAKRAQRKEEEKLGRKFTKEEEKIFRKKEIKKLRKRAAIITTLAAIGIGVTKTKLLNAPKGNNIIGIEQSENKSKEEQFRESMQLEVKTIHMEEVQNKENISQQIAKQYNSKYKENLKEEDIGYIKSRPAYFKIDKNDNYVVDYRNKVKAKEVIENSGNNYTLYVTINKNNDEIISAIGKIDDKVVNVQAKQVMTHEKEYFESEKTIDITIDENGNKKENLDEIYNEIENSYEERNNDRGI